MGGYGMEISSKKHSRKAQENIKIDSLEKYLENAGNGQFEIEIHDRM